MSNRRETKLSQAIDREQPRRWERYQRAVFTIAYNSLGCIAILFIAIYLLSGNNSLELYLRNDLLPVTERVMFVLSWPVAYCASLVTLIRRLPAPSYDTFNRIVAVNLLVFATLGFLWWALLRIPLLSRTILFTEFLLTLIFLLLFFFLKAL